MCGGPCILHIKNTINTHIIAILELTIFLTPRTMLKLVVHSKIGNIFISDHAAVYLLVLLLVLLPRPVRELIISYKSSKKCKIAEQQKMLEGKITESKSKVNYCYSLYIKFTINKTQSKRCMYMKITQGNKTLCLV